MEIKNIIFDFGGVLVEWNPRYLYKDLFKNESEMEYFLENICNHSWNEQQDAGRPLVEATKTLVDQYPEHEAMIHRYYDEWEVMIKGEISENVEVLYQLAKTKYRLFGLSNWSGETFPIARKRFPFFEELEGIVISGDEKMIKPDRKIYHLLLDRYQLEAADSLFIDDNAANILVANEIGFHTVHFDNGLNLRGHLTQLGILEP